MKKVFKIVTASALAASFGLSLTACGKKDEDAGVLNVMLGTSVKSLDAQVATDGESFEVIANFTDGLMQMDAEGAAVNAIAESYTVSEDGKTYTFKIRDAVWANDAEVTAQDFVFGWQHGCDAAKEYAYMFSDIGQVKNADKILKGEEKEDGTKYTVADLGVTAVDKDTLKVELEVPVPYFLSLMYFPTFYPVNEAFYKAVGAEKYATTADTVLANGAFKLKTYSAGGSVLELEKNEKYWDKDRVSLDGIKYQVLGDSTAALNAYQSGTLDLVTVSGSQMDQVKGSAELKTTGAGYMWYLTFAQKEGTTTTYPDGFPTRSKNLRLAITNAIDRVAIADNILKDGSLPTYTACPPQFAACSDGAHKGEDYAANQERYKDVCSYDKTKALQYFEKAKQELGKTAITLELLIGNDEGGEVPKIAQMLKAQIEEALPGLTININATTKKNRLNKIQNDCDYQVCLTRWGPDYADPMTYFGMWITGTSNNYGLWSNKDYDALIKACSDGSLTYEQRWEKLYEAEKIVMEEAVIAPLFTKSNANMIKSNVTGVEFHPVALNRVYKNAKKA